MIKILLLVLLYFGSLNADFYVVDGGQVVKIVNEPIGGADIIGTNGKLLKKHRRLSSAKRYALKYKAKKRYKKRYSKKKKIAKRKTYKKRKVVRKKKIAKRKTYKKRKVVRKKTYKKKDYIIIKTSERKLYHYLNDKLNKIYDIAVGKKENQHFGTYWVSKKVKWPDWIPTKNIKKEFPNLPDVVKGGKYNPLGARALYLGHSAYRIHGTNRPKSIGKAASHGCFRMHNKDVINLYNQARIGTKVYIR